MSNISKETVRMQTLESQINQLAKQHPDIFNTENHSEKAVQILSTLLATAYGKSQIEMLLTLAK